MTRLSPIRDVSRVDMGLCLVSKLAKNRRVFEDEMRMSVQAMGRVP